MDLQRLELNGLTFSNIETLLLHSGAFQINIEIQKYCYKLINTSHHYQIFHP